MKRFLITLAALVAVITFASPSEAQEDIDWGQELNMKPKSAQPVTTPATPNVEKKKKKTGRRAPAKAADDKAYLEVPDPEGFVEVFDNPEEFWKWVSVKKMEDDGEIITTNNIGPIITRIFLWIIGIIFVVGLIIFIWKMATKPWKVDKIQTDNIKWNSKNISDMLIILVQKGVITQEDLDSLQDEKPSDL